MNAWVRRSCRVSIPIQANKVSSAEALHGVDLLVSRQYRANGHVYRTHAIAVLAEVTHTEWVLHGYLQQMLLRRVVVVSFAMPRWCFAAREGSHVGLLYLSAALFR
jgi:hypothetical protein